MKLFSDDKVRPWLDATGAIWVKEGFDIVSQPYHGYTPDEHLRIMGMYHDYADGLINCINKAYQQSLNTPNKELTPVGGMIYEATNDIYLKVLERHYRRVGKQDPNKIILPSRQLSSAELIISNANIYKSVSSVFTSLLAETRYSQTGILSWHGMYFTLDLTFGRQWIIERLCRQLGLYEQKRRLFWFG